MTEFLATHEPTIRLAVFIGLFGILALSEYLRPRRKLTAPKGSRWFTNAAIVVIDSVVVRLIFPAAAVGVALWAQSNGYGLFNMVDAPLWVAGLVSIVVLDFAVWLSHLLSHKVPMFWRFHRMHHSDTDIDVSTAIRFHPVEIVASMVYKVAWVVALGAPAWSVILFEIILNGVAMFNHANLKLPVWLDRIVRLVVVTPDMHRVHHSTVPRETDSNYGFNFPFWDRMFGTYIAQPSAGHDGMHIGLEEWQDERPQKLGWALSVPLLPLNKD
ncbi:sterol desaturase family protein [Pseudahrensia aquimaris]|uniref:Sterol desaturase family protein n=1 Tax=Pseudahrensia aquimaris TaxID=744461 RepID=A0ABW3FME6_9HYPH